MNIMDRCNPLGPPALRGKSHQIRGPMYLVQVDASIRSRVDIPDHAGQGKQVSRRRASVGRNGNNAAKTARIRGCENIPAVARGSEAPDLVDPPRIQAAQAAGFQGHHVNLFSGLIPGSDGGAYTDCMLAVRKASQLVNRLKGREDERKLLQLSR